MIKGKQSIEFENTPYVIGYACTAGKKEGEAPCPAHPLGKRAFLQSSAWKLYRYNK